MRRFFVGLLVLLSTLCLLISSTSLWTRRNVINTEVFVGNTETMIHDPAVQNRVATAVTTQVMANPDVQSAIDSAMSVLPPGLQRFRPTVADGVRSVVNTGVHRLLTSDAFTAVTTATLTHAHNQLVNGQPVRFTIGQAKNLVPAAATGGLAGQVLALVPDNIGITVVTPASAPRLYNAIDLLKTVWLWIGLVALALLAGALTLSHRRRKTLRGWSVTLTVLVLVVLATLRLVRGPLLAAVKPVNRDAVSAMWNVIAGSLRSWNLWLLGIALLVLVGTLVWGRLGVVAGIRRASAAARSQMRERREARAVVAAEGHEGAVAGTEPGAAVVPAEPWHRRVAAATGAFFAGLELDRRTAWLGSLVRVHLRTARWAGIVIGALVLLFWPAPTLRVLIWIAAWVAIYLGALEWLQAHAPEAAEEEEPRPAGVPPVSGAAPVPAGPVLAAPTDPAVPVNGRADGRGLAAGVPADQGASVPSPRESQEPLKAEGLADLSDRLDLILRLGSARDSGVITEDEFAREKARVLPT